ncbi:MAG: rod shape-determining protein RodA [Candidatus Moranbacteria bacterium]|nr:rod shape-determining protein RodA [Candidatus Moranbacteria bacterium]MBP7695727.1 rod shape-determining protein RodA [Candidatus Moranbacteria bacterium]
MTRRLFQFDWVLLAATLLLLGVSLLSLYSLSSGGGTNYFAKQALFAGLGMGVMFFVAFLDYRHIERASTPLYFSMLFILTVLLVIGSTVRGTSGWLSLGIFQIQPVEFAKVVLILFLSSFIRKKTTELGEWTRIIASLFLSAIMIFLVLRQPDLGSSLVLMAIWIGMIVVAGLRWSHVITLAVLGSLLVFSAWFLLAPYQKDRINTFLHPELDPKGSGYNVLQSMVAVGSGGVFGKGVGHGSQSQLSFLPEKHTDFIYAVVTEELGLVGAWLVLVLYGVILYRIRRIADLASDNAGYLLSVGALILFLTHIAINIGMNIGVLPVTGLPAPLLSYGGSSLLAFSVMLGLLQSVYRHKRDELSGRLSLDRNLL